MNLDRLWAKYLSSHHQSLLHLTAPLAIALSLGVSLLMPNNSFFWNALNSEFPAPPDPRICIVAIDDQSLREYSHLNHLDYDLYAQSIKTLNLAGVSVIGIDILLDTSAPGDNQLASVLAGSNNVVLATTLQQPLPMARWKVPGGIAALNLTNAGLLNGQVNFFQTAYLAADGQLWPTLSAQMVRLLQKSAPSGTDSISESGSAETLELTPQSRLLRYSATDIPTISFRDLIGGEVKYSDLKDKVVLLGFTASGLPDNTFIDGSGTPVPGVVLQARAVSSLLQQPYEQLSTLMVALVGVLIGVLTVVLRGYWGFVLALGCVLLGIVGFMAHLLLPAITWSLVAMLSGALVVAERQWLLRQVQHKDPLTGLGNRFGFDHALQSRWAARYNKPIGLLLLDLNQFHQINERYGRQVGNSVLQQIATTLTTPRSRKQHVFRWSADEFAILVEEATMRDLEVLLHEVRAKVAALDYQDIALSISIGKSLSEGLEGPTDLIDRASRDRYRMKYQESQRQ